MILYQVHVLIFKQALDFTATVRFHALILLLFHLKYPKFLLEFHFLFQETFISSQHLHKTFFKPTQISLLPKPQFSVLALLFCYHRHLRNARRIFITSLIISFRDARCLYLVTALTQL